MRLRLEKIASTPSGLVMGVSVRGPKDSWIRFAILNVPYGEIPPSVVDEYWNWMDRYEREVDTDLALPLDWGS